jgi:hypothetical protein
MTDRARLGTTRGLYWRVARWVALGAALPALWACNTNRPVKPVPELSGSTSDLYQTEINRNIDIVFMIDDSSSMTPLQNKLAANFPVFMNVLKGLPRGLPNVHIGVVSSSMGAGRNPSVDHCPQGGDRGVFHAAALGPTCAQGSLNPGQSFISSANGVTNYTGDIADVFSCIAPLGDGGCGFEHQFASVLRALGADGQPPPPENAGFLRPDAYLMVVLITNEDDCSAPPDSALFDSSSALVSDPFGPLQSYRCNEFGHTCGGHAPPRTPAGPTDLTGTCMSAEDGRLLRVADVVAALKKLKADPTKVFVSAIAGPPDPYVVDVVPAELPDVSMWPVVDHSCTQKEPDGSVTYGDPSIRIAEWVKAFGQNGVFETICAGSFAPALERVAEETRDIFDAGCVQGKVLDTSGAVWTGSTTPDCAVIDHATNDQGVEVDTVLPPCAPGQNAGPTACWYLEANQQACPGSSLVAFNRPPGTTPPFDLNSSVSCSILVCPPKGTPGAPAGC